VKSRVLFAFILTVTLLIGVATTKISLAQSAQPIAAPAQQVSALSAMTLDHAAIRVGNFDETVEWYKENLGFQELIRWKAPPYVDPDLQFAYLELNGGVIEIAGGGNPKRLTAPPQTIGDTFLAQGYIHVCLRVNDMDAVVEELKKREVEVFAGPNVNPTLNRKFVHFRDNNGFDVELVQYL
jgi:catechol 2,3-dioxygenase-like lactoylglutathione lyase family enzyme